MADIAPERITQRMIIDHVCGNYHAWAELPDERKKAIVRQIERSCYNSVIKSCTADGVSRLFSDSKFVLRYSVICSKIISNLDVNSPVKSDYLIMSIISGAIDANNVADMSSAELCPDANADIRNIIETRQNRSAIQKVSHEYTCDKCKKNETTRKEYQARAGDESSNEMIVCINCGNSWRI